MASVFVDQVVRKQESARVPISPPQDPHPTRGVWVNEALSAYRSVFGDVAYEQHSPNDIPWPMPENTLGERFKQAASTQNAKFGFGMKALTTGHRATHMRGVGGRGTITIVDRPKFPEHEFFTAGHVFPCRLRHANASFYDDASSQVRACSLKFADSDFTSPLDILMNTGVIQAFWNFKSFMAFVYARAGSTPKDWHRQREWLKTWPGAFVGIVESVRIAPTSFAAMLYHTCLMYPFRARDGKNRYAKYRLVPCGLALESGFLDSAHQYQPWIQTRDSNDDRPNRYLEEEYRNRVAGGPVEYTLQIQVREFIEDEDTWEFFNGARIWDTNSYPWLDLAQVGINEALPYDVTERMKFWLGNQPPSLGLTASFSNLDYRSMAPARYHVYPVSQRSRWLARSLGISRHWKGDL